MRRQGQYADTSTNVYVGAQMPHLSAQRMENRPESDHFQGRLEAFTPERENPYVASQVDGQWRWERDESKMPNRMASRIFNEGQGVDASRSYFQGKGLVPEHKLALEKQGVNDPRFGHSEEGMQIDFEDKPVLQNFEGFEQKLFDNLIKLVKEQNDAEDAENSRHTEKINAINAQYQEQLAALRTRHSSRRDEFLRNESLARQHQYQQAMMDHASTSGMGDPRRYSASVPPAVINETHRAYSTDNFESYRERGQFLGGSRDQGFEPGGPYQGGRAYETGRRYY